MIKYVLAVSKLLTTICSFQIFYTKFRSFTLSPDGNTVFAQVALLKWQLAFQAIYKPFPEANLELRNENVTGLRNIMEASPFGSGMSYIHFQNRPTVF
jgi:hypothetical protein